MNNTRLLHAGLHAQLPTVMARVGIFLSIHVVPAVIKEKLGVEVIPLPVQVRFLGLVFLPI